MEEEKGQLASKPRRDNSKNGFAQYQLFSQLFLNVLLNNLRQPTPVQKKVLPLVMEGKDVVTCYKTGSGKTLSYLLPIINKLRSHSQIVGARALILIPTRDLADQITRVLKSFLRKIDLKYSLILGGHTYEGQFQSLSANPDIIIATPGRLMQLLVETDFQLSRVQIVVFDEADQLFGENKFEKELKEILSKCPNSQRLMFSATITPDLSEFASAGLRDYSYIHQEITLPETMKIDFFVVRPEEKAATLLCLLERFVKKQKVIVFASTRFHVDYLLCLVGTMHKCFGIYGKMDMEQRTCSLESFRAQKRAAVLIVTDVAARGLDIPDVNFVIHYDYPSNHHIFVHRSGRTARAEKAGHAIAMITHHEVSFMVQLAGFVAKQLDNSLEKKDCINYGVIPSPVLASYVNLVVELTKKNSEVQSHRLMSLKAFEKFKKCRTETSQNSMKKAKSLDIQTHHYFLEDMESEEHEFLKRVHSFTPKKSFLELQRIVLDREPETDTFLCAIQKIKHQQQIKSKQIRKRERLRQRKSERWREILDKHDVQEYQDYQESRQRLPIRLVEGINIELTNSALKKNMDQYISSEKNHTQKTQFDDLPRIKTTEVDEMIQDENMAKRSSKKRVWDKTKKNFVWQRDLEDKLSKQQKGKKAYLQWKKKSKLSIPIAGQAENPEQVGMAKQNWLQRRKFRHGWKDDKPQEKSRGRNLKNNKTKAVEKKFKTRLISKSMNTKAGGRGSKPARGSKAGRAATRGRRGGQR